MEDIKLIVDLVLAVVAAFVGGVVAQRLGQPVILGYLLAGVAIGPFSPGPVADVRSVQVLADIGVAFLMFTLGAEFSFRELRRLGRVATLGGALQILFTMGLGPLLAPALGLAVVQGVFLAGLVVAESEYRTQVVAEAMPLRDLFASLFFVSVGMLINPATLASQAGLVALLSGVTIVAKVGIVAVVVLLFGFPARVALLSGLSLAQLGAFSFVLARIGVDRGGLPPALFGLTLATALVTIVLTPSLLRAGPALATALARLPVLGRHVADPVEADVAAAAS